MNPTIPIHNGGRGVLSHSRGPQDVAPTRYLLVDAVIVDPYPALLSGDQSLPQETQRHFSIQEVPRIEHAPESWPVQACAVAVAGQRDAIGW